MTDTSRAATPRHSFAELSRSQCEEMLAGESIGRVAWNAPDGPQVLPVNYRWLNGEIIFRTTPDGVLSWVARRERVAFEVDDIDLEARTAWSVQVRGTAEAMRNPQELLNLWSSSAVVPWASGQRTLFIGITPSDITGRVVRAW